jgi:hypothetical protein
MTQRITEQMVKDMLKKLNAQMCFNITNTNNRYFKYDIHDNEYFLNLMEEENNQYISLVWAGKRFKTKKELYIYLLGLLDYETCVNCDL